jgi:protoglobin
MDMHDLSRRAMEDMPPGGRFRPEDSQVIQAHQNFLAGLENAAVEGFYDTLYAHPPTRRVFSDGERPMREETLSQWWRRTIHGPHDEEYFSWMAMVGLVHVLRDVSNPMMLAMTDFVARFVTASAEASDLSTQDARQLSEAFRRLSATVAGIITFGYDQAVESALFDVAGMPSALLHRLRNQEVATSLTKARTDLGR